MVPSKKVIAVDFDGVIAEYNGWDNGLLGQPRSDVVQALHQLRSEGWQIIIHSCRPSDILRPYLEERHIPFDQINPGSPYDVEGCKPSASVYWDDRAFKYTGDAWADLDQIRNFRTWNGRE